MGDKAVIDLHWRPEPPTATYKRSTKIIKYIAANWKKMLESCKDPFFMQIKVNIILKKDLRKMGLFFFTLFVHIIVIVSFVVSHLFFMPICWRTAVVITNDVLPMKAILPFYSWATFMINSTRISQTYNGLSVIVIQCIEWTTKRMEIKSVAYL